VAGDGQFAETSSFHIGNVEIYDIPLKSFMFFMLHYAFQPSRVVLARHLLPLETILRSLPNPLYQVLTVEQRQAALALETA